MKLEILRETKNYDLGLQRSFLGTNNKIEVCFILALERKDKNIGGFFNGLAIFWPNPVKTRYRQPVKISGNNINHMRFNPLKNKKSYREPVKNQKIFNNHLRL